MKTMMSFAAEYDYFSFSYFFGEAILGCSARSEIQMC